MYMYVLFLIKRAEAAAICDFHQKYDGFDDLDPEEIVVGPGSKELIYLVMHVFNGGK